MPPIPRKVLIVELGRVYLSAREAAKAIRGEFSAVYAVLRGERGQHRGYTFRYHDEEED
jgi:hypothetical protein